MTGTRFLGAVLAVVAIGACGEEVRPNLSIADYKSWMVARTRTDPTPAHGDTYRIIYVNPLATEKDPDNGLHLEGAIIVKEIYEKNARGERGALKYLAIMRKVQRRFSGNPEPSDGGWLFTDRDGSGGSERKKESCPRCHRQAPYDFTWYDYVIRRMPDAAITDARMIDGGG